MTKKLQLKREWELGDPIGAGGFGQVFRAKSRQLEAAAKLVPKAPGGQRELLFVDLGDARNIVPIIDSGETEDSWVLVMPMAEMSLRQRIDDGPIGIDEAVAILKDICLALADLDGTIVHRDLKPENILLLDKAWCLADFGISRYAEATTAPDTQKYALSAPYAGPERWRFERASAATDLYSVGIIAFELLAGHLPFLGPTYEAYRDQHLHSAPPPLTEVPASLAALVDECLYKAPGARPSPANILARLEHLPSTAASEGLSKLQEANRLEVARRAESARRESTARTEAERRSDLLACAKLGLDGIGSALCDAISAGAPAASITGKSGGGWTMRLGSAELSLSRLSATDSDPWKWEAPALDVIGHASLSLSIPPDSYGYEGRSHSLWYCDAQESANYAWYETSFMFSALINRRGRQNPFALDPGEESAKALWTGMAEFQVAWPFTPLTLDTLDEFIDRWAGWLADAAAGTMHHPRSMPERNSRDSWRRS